ncbi:hypothetical protein D3C81_1261020 [compost metagenome]
MPGLANKIESIGQPGTESQLHLGRFEVDLGFSLGLEMFLSDLGDVILIELTSPQPQQLGSLVVSIS